MCNFVFTRNSYFLSTEEWPTGYETVQSGVINKCRLYVWNLKVLLRVIGNVKMVKYVSQSLRCSMYWSQVSLSYPSTLTSTYCSCSYSYSNVFLRTATRLVVDLCGARYCRSVPTSWLESGDPSGGTEAGTLSLCTAWSTSPSSTSPSTSVLVSTVSWWVTRLTSWGMSRSES